MTADSASLDTASPSTTHTSWVEIDRAALLHNVRAFRRLIDDRTFAAVVKGNAYGHDIAAVARPIEPEVVGFSVNSLDEALGLRRAGCTLPVLIMGATVPGRFDEVVADGFRQVVFNCDAAAALAEAGEAFGDPLGSGAVLVTGSVVTGGEARTMLRRRGMSDVGTAQ